MRVRYHGGDCKLSVVVPDRISWQWVKYLLPAMAANRGYNSKYGYWVGIE